MIRAIPLGTTAKNFNFGVTELLVNQKNNMASRSAGGTKTAMCGYDNRHYDCTCDCLCYVTYSVV